jgi:formylglycine-generating enzyme required for sulfatase activity
MKGAPLEPTDTGTALGFRLVHDSAGRVVRGGCWLVDASVARVAYRGYFDPASAVYDFGFRLCVDWGK